MLDTFLTFCDMWPHSCIVLQPLFICTKEETYGRAREEDNAHNVDNKGDTTPVVAVLA